MYRRLNIPRVVPGKLLTTAASTTIKCTDFMAAPTALTEALQLTLPLKAWHFDMNRPGLSQSAAVKQQTKALVLLVLREVAVLL